MASYVCIVLKDELDSIAQLNAKLFQPSGSDALNGGPCLHSLQRYLNGAQSGTLEISSMQVTTRDSAPSISTSGTDSAQNSYTKLS